MERAGNTEIIKPSGDFEQVSGEIIRNYPPLVIGVYCKLLSFGKDWAMNIKGLSKSLNISVDKTREAITMLEEGGFITRTARQGENGKFLGWHYRVYGNPVESSERTNAGVASERFIPYPADLAKNRQHGKPTTRKTDMSENDQDNIIILKSNNILENKEKDTSEDVSKKKEKNQSQFLAEGQAERKGCAEKKETIPSMVEELREMWNEAVSNTGASIPKCRIVSESSQSKIGARLKEMSKHGEWREIAKEIIDKTCASDFLQGKSGDRRWRADFKWVFESPSNWTKVYDGRYDNGEGPQQVANGDTRCGVKHLKESWKKVEERPLSDEESRMLAELQREFGWD